MHVTDQQKQILLNYMKKYPELLRGRVGSANRESKRKLEDTWAIVSQSLNASGYGPQKQQKEWEKTWGDWKRNTLRKVAEMKSHIRGTGGGPPLNETLSLLEKELMEILTPDSAGLSTVPEGGFDDNITLCDNANILNASEDINANETFSFNTSSIKLKDPKVTRVPAVISGILKTEFQTVDDQKSRPLSFDSSNQFMTSKSQDKIFKTSNHTNKIQSMVFVQPSQTSATKSSTTVKFRTDTAGSFKGSLNTDKGKVINNSRKRQITISGKAEKETRKKRTRPVECAINLLQEKTSNTENFQKELLKIKGEKLSLAKRKFKFKKQFAAQLTRRLLNLTSAIDTLNETIQQFAPQYLDS